MARTLHLLCAGAAQGLVTALAEPLLEDLDLVTTGRFGAVGAMKEAFDSGEPCDVLVSTDTMLREMIAQGTLLGPAPVPLGRVRTGVAVPVGRPAPAVDTPESLARALAAASSVWLPDMYRSTAGEHMARVLDALGLLQTLESRIRMFPNGATAMREMAAAGDPDAIGCTQVTEILFTAGVELIALLPSRFELSTVYSAAVSTRSERPDLAHAFIAQLVSPDHARLADRCGFERDAG